MAKKFGKFVMTTAALSALAAGAYYFLKKKESLENDYFDDEDEFDDFDEDLDESDADRKSEADRKYVDLDLTKAAEAVSEKAEDFKEGLNAAKAEAEDKIVGAAEDAAKAVNDAETKVEEFFNDEEDENSNSSNGD